MLEVINLAFDYEDKSLFRQVDLVVRPGELLHVCGNNGTGKTLLRLLAGLVLPSRGEIRYENQAIQQKRLSYQSQVCYIGHRLGIHTLLTPRENCFFNMSGREALGYSRQDAKRHLESLLAAFGLRDHADEPCFHLSAGQRRRVALLRLAFTQAKLWLLDEPFASLDTPMIAQIGQLLETHLFQGEQVVLTSHQTLPLATNFPYRIYGL